MVLAALLAGLAVRLRSRRLVAGLLAVLFVVFAAEAAVHSVHHLSSNREAVSWTR